MAQRVKEKSPCNTGDPGFGSLVGRILGGGNGYPLQYSCLENVTDRGAWQTTVHGVAKSQTRLKRLSTKVQIGCCVHDLDTQVGDSAASNFTCGIDTVKIKLGLDNILKGC